MTDPSVRLQPAPPGPHAAERRAAVRLSCQLESLCHAVPDGEDDTFWPATVWDVSTTGLGLVVSRPFAPGTLLGVELESPDGECAYTLLTEVVHASPRGDGWVIGCAFARELSEDELRRLL